MRLKKQKRHRKVVRFYSACFGFREPYKVLCDGTFIHHILLHGLTPADKSLSNLLGARVLLFTSRCVIGELTSLGESHAVALEAAHQIMTAMCDHEKRVDAETCIQSIIGESNSEHFFLATQDSEIRKKFREVPGVPVIYGLRNSLFLEQPSLNQKEFVKSTEEKRLHMDESEYQKIWKRGLKEKLTSAGAVSTSMEEFAKTNRSNSMITLGAVDKVRLKKRRAKGPNPLSCKKKKQNEGASVTKNQNGLAAGTLNKRKRNRKRKREDKESKSEQPKS
ncbi:rRNA-processing protein UTP23 homolog [Dendrobium catenatum]|uniref:UTP23 sensor motif region domain-containing protein n=1 Tax=Dendrobium catenatum TaxID=906689 RepID=A0A2I0VJA4_9ASPA|nr:rRNA-processing protein UTP23 homolog [Dendrobium catenatum]XP_020677630.1 rRNA-processing protein UTP23 homolog [Dendrobium catenatum]XP_028557122.1 rRNA-processing protein UTP23 homolog [Dendrobium catenatum]PKU63502.1 hypothetical protein MA16_Dca019311 [Dendrobium catenatum]